MINRALTRVVAPSVTDQIQDFGFLPALIGIAAAVAPALMGSPAKAQAKAAQRAELVQKAKEKKEAEARKASARTRNLILMVGGGVLLLTITGIIVIKRKGKK